MLPRHTQAQPNYRAHWAVAFEALTHAFSQSAQALYYFSIFFSIFFRTNLYSTKGKTYSIRAKLGFKLSATLPKPGPFINQA